MGHRGAERPHRCRHGQHSVRGPARQGQLDRGDEPVDQRAPEGPLHRWHLDVRIDVVLDVQLDAAGPGMSGAGRGRFRRRRTGDTNERTRHHHRGAGEVCTNHRQR